MERNKRLLVPSNDEISVFIMDYNDVNDICTATGFHIINKNNYTAGIILNNTIAPEHEKNIKIPLFGVHNDLKYYSLDIAKKNSNKNTFRFIFLDLYELMTEYGINREIDVIIDKEFVGLHDESIELDEFDNDKFFWNWLQRSISNNDSEYTVIVADKPPFYYLGTGINDEFIEKLIDLFVSNKQQIYYLTTDFNCFGSVTYHKPISYGMIGKIEFILVSPINLANQNNTFNGPVFNLTYDSHFYGGSYLKHKCIAQNGYAEFKHGKKINFELVPITFDKVSKFSVGFLVQLLNKIEELMEIIKSQKNEIEPGLISLIISFRNRLSICCTYIDKYKCMTIPLTDQNRHLKIDVLKSKLMKEINNRVMKLMIEINLLEQLNS
jgi:hypothetical protein